MKITNIEYFRLDMALAIPYTIAYETVSKTTNIILRIDTDKGITGWGCSAPDLEVTNESPEDVISNIENIVIRLLKNQSPFQIAHFTHILKQLCPRASSTRAMVDMALFDLMARKAKLPLYQLLGGYKDRIATSITIGILSVKDTLDQAGYYLKQGFTIIKLKGGLNLAEDIEKILKIREKYGNDIVLRFDANQGYSYADAIEFVEKTKSAKIEILEQPTKQTKDDLLGKLTQNIDLPVMADESIRTLKDAFRLASNDLIDMVNIKLMKVGGILESQHINAVAKAAGLETMVGCIDECALGISAGLHFALSRPNIEFADLDGHLDLIDDPFSDLFFLKKGVLYPTHDYGLGKINL
ncbi:mandelate racemase/muconate lactonizing enzyme family protein [Draconibacterium mangrovi]|uniref:mandelate racemase/muconate lactonizing enzyme family protein n=1 Tax=Draconibacterium mangrovi TaxID=2697469 RepID=UPI0013D555E9|nr:dipeptide epimerase [Draconibacterium mangrovi]